MHRTENLSELLTLMTAIKRSLHGEAYRMLHDSGLTGSQIALMSILQRSEPLPARSLAEQLCVSPGAISQVIEPLAHAEYVARTQHTDDRRSFDLTLTPKGHETMETIEQARLHIITEATADLSDEDIGILTDMHRRVFAAVQKKHKHTDKN